tara:strand:- start:5242 stop:5898 length:657 start_codon:yes stop_codon:yes gene_type:complete
MGKRPVHSIRAAISQTRRVCEGAFECGIDPLRNIFHRNFRRCGSGSTEAIDQILESLTSSRRYRDDIDPESIRQSGAVDGNTLRTSQVDHIHRDDTGEPRLEYFRHEVEVSLQVNHVGNDKNRREGSFAIELVLQHFPHNFLVGRPAIEGIASGKIEQIEVGSVGEPEAALFTFDRNAGVVADALMQPRQGVKKGRLPRVRVPDDPNQWRFFIRLDVC